MLILALNYFCRYLVEFTARIEKQLAALFKKLDYLTRSDKVRQREDRDSSFDTYKSTKGEFLYFFNKTTIREKFLYQYLQFAVYE
jgi:hypothetical protein